MYLSILQIQYAKDKAEGVRGTFGERYDTAQKRVMDIWEQINQEDIDEDETPVVC